MQIYHYTMENERFELQKIANNTVEMAVSSSKMRQIAIKSTFKQKNKNKSRPHRKIFGRFERQVSLSTRTSSCCICFFLFVHLTWNEAPGMMSRSLWVMSISIDQHQSARPLLCQGVWRRDCCNPPADAQLLPTRKQRLHHGELMGIHQFHDILQPLKLKLEHMMGRYWYFRVLGVHIYIL